jgi:hypothetical protein
MSHLSEHSKINAQNLNEIRQFQTNLIPEEEDSETFENNYPKEKVTLDEFLLDVKQSHKAISLINFLLKKKDSQ